MISWSSILASFKSTWWDPWFSFVVFYFFLIRPQQRRAKEHKAMIAAIKRGDKIVTSGGITGVVTKAVDGRTRLKLKLPKT